VGARTLDDRDVLAPSWPEAGLTGRQIITPDVWTSDAVTLDMPDRPRHRWPALKSLLTAANLSVAEIYEPPRRHLTDIGHNYVIVLGADVIGMLADEPEAIMAFASKRPTLWLSEPVPLLPRRRAFFGLVSADDE
jgi:hypothetical protein